MAYTYLRERLVCRKRRSQETDASLGLFARRHVSFAHVEVIPEVDVNTLVYAVYDETRIQPDAPTMGSFVRHLRPRMEREANSTAFPVMCYVGKRFQEVYGLRPLDLTQTAADLLNTGRCRPRQSNLRRAMSTVYYAMFHCLAKCCADTIVGGRGATRSSAAWTQAYRALDHGQARNRCANQKDP